jgi:sec-independent protein translocase protein TatA
MLDFCFQIAFIGPGGPELLVVMLVLLLMFGAKDAPKIFRKINEMLNSVRNTADGFKREIMYGDHNNESSDSSGDTYSVDDDDDYTEYHDDDYDSMDDDERDYSDETFQNLEKDLEESSVAATDEKMDPAPAPVAEPTESDEEADDARKA